MNYCSYCFTQVDNSDKSCRNCFCDNFVKMYFPFDQCGLCEKYYNGHSLTDVDYCLTVFQCGHWVCSFCTFFKKIKISPTLLCYRCNENINRIKKAVVPMFCERKYNSCVYHKDVKQFFRDLYPHILNFKKNPKYINEKHIYAIKLLTEYYKWLILKGINDDLIPSLIINKVWKQHLLDTISYADLCYAICGHKIHHKPIKDVREHNKMRWLNIEKFIKMYEREFGKFSYTEIDIWDLSGYNFNKGKIEIFVKTITGKTQTIYVFPDGDISDIKTAIYEKEYISTDIFTLEHRNKPLLRGSIRDNGIEKGATLYLCLKPEYKIQHDAKYDKLKIVNV